MSFVNAIFTSVFSDEGFPNNGFVWINGPIDKIDFHISSLIIFPSTSGAFSK